MEKDGLVTRVVYQEVPPRGDMLRDFMHRK
ncbi:MULTISPECIES: hypothetical protein [Bacillales]|uniref:Uncharacterized protein n=1 Tax=Kroppenstedtia sanguinis TaxID=1380684 RepID=A0ABW4CAN8_9BACL